VIEAKAWDEALTEGVGQAKDYAASWRPVRLLHQRPGHSTRSTWRPAPRAKSSLPDAGGTLEPDLSPTQNAWRDRFAAVPFEDKGGYFQGRYYQDIAIERVLEGHRRRTRAHPADAGHRHRQDLHRVPDRVEAVPQPLEPATGSGEPTRRPRILFLADRNILADQAYNAFSAFPEDALVRIEPADIRKKGKVPKNGSIFFTIFQTFMSGPPRTANPRPTSATIRRTSSTSS
jgi:type I restriction enzyme R subunit